MYYGESLVTDFYTTFLHKVYIFPSLVSKFKATNVSNPMQFGFIPNGEYSQEKAHVRMTFTYIKPY